MGVTALPLVAGLRRIPPGGRLTAVGVLAAVAAVLVGHQAAINPAASPHHISAAVRIAIIGLLVGSGIYAQTSHIQTRMGAWLIAAGLFSSVWLLNGSGNRAAFSIGALAAGAAPGVFCYLMLAHPGGRLRVPRERWLLLGCGGGLLVFWIILLLTSGQPPVRTGLMQCTPHCPRNVLTIGSLPGGLSTVLKVGLWVAWALLVTGTAWFAGRHTRSGPAPVRHSVTPVAITAAAAAIVWIGFGLATAFGSHLAQTFGTTYSELALVIPVAIVVGLGTERLFMGRALAAFVTTLAQRPDADPQPLMARALEDPLLRIGYVRQGQDRCVDFAGRPLATDHSGRGVAINWLRQGEVPVAVVIYDAAIEGQDRFVEAAGAAALMRLERARLQLELKHSVADLAASRVRLVETADAERQKIERDLHDSIQQDMVGLRIKLDLVAEAYREDPTYGELMMTQLGRQMDDVLEALRAVARGVYPSLLRERGPTEALKSVARRAPMAVAVHSGARGRYPEDVEVAIYFCCVEALQNAIKHGGQAAVVDIRLREEPGFVSFAVSDTGPGFDLAELGDSHGLLNMRDRAEALGGSLTVSSGPGRGTLVEGRIPLG